MCSGLLTGPLIGYIAQRVGLRTVGIVGLTGHSLAYVVLSLNTGSLVLWYLSWALVAILGAAQYATWITLSAVSYMRVGF